MISIPNHELGLHNFTSEEVEKVYIDPGRKSAFTATINLDSTQHRVRRCSTKEYYHFTGSTVYSSKLQERWAKRYHCDWTWNTDVKVYAYYNYMLTHLKTLFTFQGFHTAKSRFNLYKGKQRAREYMVNMLLDGTPKYNRKKRRKKIISKQRKRKKNEGVKLKGKEKELWVINRYHNFKFK